MIADLLVAVGPSPSAISDAKQLNHILARRPPFGYVGSHRAFSSTPAATPPILRLKAALSLAPERLHHRLPPVSSVLAASSRPLVARSGGSRCFVCNVALDRLHVRLFSPFRTPFFYFEICWTVSFSKPIRVYHLFEDVLGHRAFIEKPLRPRDGNVSALCAFLVATIFYRTMGRHLLTWH